MAAHTPIQCPRCGGHDPSTPLRAGLAEIDILIGRAKVNGFAEDGSIDWDSQAPQHNPPRFECGDCGQQWTLDQLRGGKADSPTDVRFIVARDGGLGDGVTLAIVKAQVADPGQARESVFLANLQSAVTAWIVETEDGRATWEATAFDFNVGDLAMELTDGEGTSALDELVERLEVKGIYNLSVQIVGEPETCQDWTFDTVLVNRRIAEAGRSRLRKEDVDA